MDYTVKDLEMWNDRIEEVVKSVNLDYYPQELEKTHCFFKF